MTGLIPPYYVNSTGRLRCATAPGQKEITLEFRRVTEVDRVVAQALEEHLDAPDFDFGFGNILWTEEPAGSERGVLLYSFPFGGCF